MTSCSEKTLPRFRVAETEEDTNNMPTITLQRKGTKQVIRSNSHPSKFGVHMSLESDPKDITASR